MITRIDARKIKYQPKAKMFVWDRDNFIESKPK
jgi:hypothetical protein